MMSRFSYDGFYRVQSRRRWVPSSIEGEWIQSAAGLSNDAAANEFLSMCDLYRDDDPIALRGARISLRTGLFASDPDILYKRDCFRPKENNPPFACEMVDVSKATFRSWQRVDQLEQLFGRSLARDITENIDDVSVVAINEYLCHEIGHRMGVGITRKLREGFFSPNERVSWPLIFLEEFRADVEGWLAAPAFLGTAQAIAVFWYTLTLRFVETARTCALGGVAPYGLTPFFLFHELTEIGFLRESRTAGHVDVSASDERSVLEAIERVGARVRRSLTLPERAAATATERGLLWAEYAREILENVELGIAYERALLRGQCAAHHANLAPGESFCGRANRRHDPGLV